MGHALGVPLVLLLLGVLAVPNHGGKGVFVQLTAFPAVVEKAVAFVDWPRFLLVFFH